MTARPGFTADLARHLSADIVATIGRHADLAQSGSASPLEWSAVMMLAVESVAVQSIGCVLIVADERRRQDLFDEIIIQLAQSLERKREAIFRGVGLAESVART